VNSEQFLEKVGAHDDLRFAGTCRDEFDRAHLVVKHGPTKATYQIEPDAIIGIDWKTLESILCGKRDAKILTQMTRVVGYYSKVENWNKSKLGELKGRHGGDYRIGEDA